MEFCKICFLVVYVVFPAVPTLERPVLEQFTSSIPVLLPLSDILCPCLPGDTGPAQKLPPRLHVWGLEQGVPLPEICPLEPGGKLCQGQRNDQEGTGYFPGYSLFVSVPHCDLAFDQGLFQSPLFCSHKESVAQAGTVSDKCPVHLETFLSKHVFLFPHRNLLSR